MRRRDLAILLAGPALLPRLVRAQQAAIPVVGYLSSKSPDAEAGILAATREGLAQQGFVEGRNLAIAYRWGDGDYARLPRHAAELVGEKVSVIMASGLPAALAAKAATSTIPIVFRLAINPVDFGLAQSLNRPGGNLTGVTMLFDPLTPKKLQLLHELVPGATSIGFLVNPKNQNFESHRDKAESAARELGLRLVVLTASNAGELQAAFKTGLQHGIGALLLGDDPFFDVSKEQLVATAASHAMPTMYYVRDFTAAGGLISYGASFAEMGRESGISAGRILNGANPAGIPVVQPTKFELVINLKTARTLGLTLPPSLLAGADEVIE
ncbi:MAG: ABC transporter substrate-binding protein [Reyranellales bacterium]